MENHETPYARRESLVVVAVWTHTDMARRVVTPLDSPGHGQKQTRPGDAADYLVESKRQLALPSPASARPRRAPRRPRSPYVSGRP